MKTLRAIVVYEMFELLNSKEQAIFASFFSKYQQQEYPEKLDINRIKEAILMDDLVNQSKATH